MIPLWLTYGPSASGKSTWARAEASNDAFVRLSMDDVRATLGKPSGDPTWTKEFEGAAFNVMLAMAKTLVASGKGVIFDNTHLASSMPSAIAKAFRHQNVIFRVKDFTDVTREECIGRDALRTGPAHVGAEVINRQFKVMRTAKLQGRPFVLTEDWLNSFNLLSQIETYRPDPSKPKAFIIDVDGTLTLGPHNRTPYEWHKVLNDKPRTEIIHLAKLLQADGYQALSMSGRSDTCRFQTLSWFAANGFRPDRLFMRAAGDNRSDEDVKLELFNVNLRNNYRIEHVIDDRERVLNVWALLGLPTLAVWPVLRK